MFTNFLHHSIISKILVDCGCRFKVQIATKYSIGRKFQIFKLKEKLDLVSLILLVKLKYKRNHFHGLNFVQAKYPKHPKYIVYRMVNCFSNFDAPLKSLEHSMRVV